MATPAWPWLLVGREGYGPSHGGGLVDGYGGGESRRGRGGYGNREPGVYRGGSRSTRSYHRSVHLLNEEVTSLTC